jgi:hypothetical protein
MTGTVARAGAGSANLVALCVTCAASLFVGEAFFKFGSFTLEVLAFLATWGASYGAASGLLRLFRPRTGRAA